MQKILVKGSPKVQLRTVAIVSAGAALLTFIGYLLIKSERKKPKKKHTNNNNTSTTTTTNKDGQELEHVIIEMEPVIKNNCDSLNESVNCCNKNENDENKMNLKCKLNDDDENLFNKSTQMPLSCSNNTEFDENNNNNTNGTNSGTNINTTTTTNNNNDKLSETSSDSGNGTSDLNNINSPNGGFEYIHNAGEYSNDDDCSDNFNNNSYKEEKKLDLSLLNNDISKLDTPPPTPTTTEAPSLLPPQPTLSINVEKPQTPQQQQTMTKSTSSHSVTSSTGSAQDTLVYEFHFPRKLCGKLIGKNGVHVDSIRKKAHVQVAVRDDLTIDELQIVSITGYITNVEKALDIINERFPVRFYPKISLKPIRKLIYKNSSNNNSNTNINNQQINNNNNNSKNHNENKVLLTSLSFIELPYVNLNNNNSNLNNNNLYNSLNGYCFDVHVSAIVNSSHIFIQVPSDPTYNSLQRLDEDMFNLYNNENNETTIPDLQEPYEYGTICAAPTIYGWHRAMITNYYKSSSITNTTTTNSSSQQTSSSSSETTDDQSTNNQDIDMVTVKFLDYGGYLNVPVNQVKQLRSDFMALPFQAVEVYLDNIQPIQGREDEGKEGLTNLIQNSGLKAIVTGYTEDTIPLIKLFKLNMNSYKSLLINNELVTLGYAQKFNYESNDHIVPSSTNGHTITNEPITSVKV